MSYAFLSLIPMKQKHEISKLKNNEMHGAHPALSPLNSSELLQLKGPQFFFDGYRFTYTHLLKGELVSIHFDSTRNEIFYRGHNIRNMTLSPAQKEALDHCQDLLIEKAEGVFAEPFKKCLAKI